MSAIVAGLLRRAGKTQAITTAGSKIAVRAIRQARPIELTRRACDALAEAGGLEVAVPAEEDHGSA